jgi:hypothetical protein
MKNFVVPEAQYSVSTGIQKFGPANIRADTTEF